MKKKTGKSKADPAVNRLKMLAGALGIRMAALHNGYNRARASNKPARHFGAKNTLEWVERMVARHLIGLGVTNLKGER